MIQGLDEYERKEEESEFIKAIAQGLLDIKEDKQIEISEVKRKLRLS